MKKSEQMAINAKVQAVVEDFYKNEEHTEEVGRLRSCSAYVMRQGKYYYLVSYRTIIAVIDTTTDTLYDFLRMVYCYTATSAQHIAKFRHDYGSGKWGCEHEFRYYPV